MALLNCWLHRHLQIVPWLPHGLGEGFFFLGFSFPVSLKPIQLSHDCPIHNYKRLNLETNPIKTGYDPRGAPPLVYTPYFITNKNKYDEILDPIKS